LTATFIYGDAPIKMLLIGKQYRVSEKPL